MQHLTQEQLAAATQLVANRMYAKGVERRGPIEVLATKYEKGTLTIAYLHDGKKSAYVVRGIPPEVAA